MFKILFTPIIIVLFLILFPYIKITYAETPISNCPNPVKTRVTNLGTIFTELNSKSENAVFEIDAGNFFNPAVTKWAIQFECGMNQQVVDDVSVSSTTITTKSIDRSRHPLEGCEFFPGNHTIVVKGDNTPICRGSYTVLDADAECELIIDPATGIIPTSDVKISGKNLTKDGQFNLYFDDNQINGFMKTPEFPAITIDKTKLSPARHTAYLRRFLGKNFQPPFGDLLGPPLCPAIFDVGTISSPGSVKDNKQSGGNATPSICQKDPTNASCAKGGGKQIPGCGIPDEKGVPDPRGPGIPTAIGCIHTNPVELVRDIMTWIIGIGGGLAFLMMLLGAFQMLTSAGNPETLAAGKSRLTSAIIGLLFVIFAVLLMQIIGVDILQLPGFGR